jgi:hypothetical protein
MKALISPMETFNISWVSSWEETNGKWIPIYSSIEDCMRVADVAEVEFDVAEPLFWVDCPEECKADVWYYKDGVCSIKPKNEADPNHINKISEYD